MAEHYTGPRPVFPGQNSGEWRHNVTDELGVYSNWSLMSSTHLLQDMPFRNHRPGDGYHPNDVLLTQMYLGDHAYAPMEVAKFSHGGQKWSVSYENGQFWQLHKPWEYHGVDSAEVFHGEEWGYSVYDTSIHQPFTGPRVFTYSRHSNNFFFGVPSAETLLGGRAYRTHAYRSAPDDGVPSGFGRSEPHLFWGVGDDKLDDSGETLEAKYDRAESSNEYAFQRTQEWNGVPSAKVL